MNKNSQTRINILLLGILLGIVLGSIGGYYFTKQYYQENPNIKTEYKTKTQTKEDPYLKESACELYEKFKGLYFEIDRMCNLDPACGGSATQKEMYNGFKSWDNFKTKYCE